MRQIWILAETRGGAVAAVSHELLAWAHSLGGQSSGEEVRVTAFLPGPASDPEELSYHGADLVIHADDARLDSLASGAISATLLAQVEAERPDVLLAAATTTGRTVLPYFAAKAGLGLTADCTELRLDHATGILYQTRPAAGGNIMATITTQGARPQASTVRPHSRQPLPRDPGRKVEVRKVAAVFPAGMEDPRLVAEKPFAESKGLSDARIVVAGGRGFGRKESFARLHELARLLDAEVGASREAVDRGWIDYPHQVGLSGRTIAPELYLAFGISGAIQHLAGMQTSDCVIAVNEDPDAPIFAVSDLAVRGDLNEILPRLMEMLEEKAK
jgi:electron transfer flavoprotein alpha subunit